MRASRPVRPPMPSLLVWLLVAASFWALNVYRLNRPVAPPEAGGDLVDVGPQTLQQLLTLGRPGILELYAGSCPDCVKLAVELARVRTASGNSLFVVKMNAVKYGAEAAKYGAETLPAVILFDASGSQKAVLPGYRDYDSLVEALRSLNLIK